MALKLVAGRGGGRLDGAADPVSSRTHLEARSADGYDMKALRVVVLGGGLAYLAWRALFTWEGTNLVLFGALLAAEAYGIARSHIELNLMRNRRGRSVAPAGEPVPADVMVLALDEPTSEIRAALLSARAIQGGRGVTLVDRDARPELAQLAARLEVTYVAGSVAADVGSLLTKTAARGTADRVVLLPGDVVVMPDVTEVSESCFDDPRVAVVLGLTEATNAAHEIDFDGYGQNRERDELVNPSLDADRALPWWSGVSVIRRDALDQVGGFAPGHRSVTLPTGVRLQAGGWRIADNGVVVARRLASSTADRHLHRWSRDLHERLEILRSEDESWTSGRIPGRIRLAYRVALIDGTRSIQRLVLMAVLFATLLGAGLPIAGPAAPIAGAWSLQMAGRLGARWIATRSTGFRSWILADLRLLTTELVVGWRVLRGRPVSEELHDPAPGRRLRSVFLAGLQTALLLAIAVHALAIRSTPYGGLATLATIGMAGWLWLVVLQAKAGLGLRQLRQGFRAKERLDVLNRAGDLVVTGISPFGVDVVSTRKIEVGDRLRLAFALPGAAGSTELMETATVVRRVRRDGRRYVGYLRFALISDEEMDRVIEYCTVVAGHREVRHEDLSVSAQYQDLEGDAGVDEGDGEREDGVAGDQVDDEVDDRVADDQVDHEVDEDQVDEDQVADDQVDEDQVADDQVDEDQVADDQVADDQVANDEIDEEDDQPRTTADLGPT